jgi:ribosomal protein S18 acetylase RimI-like enzyme
MIEIVQAESPEQIEEIRKLFREYENWLGIDLCFQDFEKELRNLPDKYAKPDGRLFLLSVKNQSAGCIALRKIDAGICEMKRLYVREQFRSLGLGKMLIEKLIGEAKTVGCKKMLLDTLPDKMPLAVKLYKSYGFCKISPYYHNPHGETLFMELDLNE